MKKPVSHTDEFKKYLHDRFSETGDMYCYDWLYENGTYHLSGWNNQGVMFVEDGFEFEIIPDK